MTQGRWSPRPGAREKGRVTSWRARVPDPTRLDPKTGKPMAKQLGTRALKHEAQALIDAWYDKAEAGLLDARTVGDYAEVWLVRHPRSERTNHTNRHRLNAVLDLHVEGRKLRDWALKELTPEEVTTLRGLMLDRWSLGYVRGILTVLSAFGVDAARDNRTANRSNPFARATVRMPKGPVEDEGFDPLPLPIMHNLARAAGDNEAQIRTLVDLGLRVGELLALKRVHFDPKGCTMMVAGTAWNGKVWPTSREKNHNRVLPVPPGLMEFLLAMPPRIDSEFLFPTPGNAATRKSRADWPAWAELAAEIEATSYKAVSRRLGVSDNAVRNRMRNYAPGVVLAPPTGGKLWRYDNWRRDVWLPTCNAAGIYPEPKDLRASLNQHFIEEGVPGPQRAAFFGHQESVNDSHYRTLRISDPASIMAAFA